MDDKGCLKISANIKLSKFNEGQEVPYEVVESLINCAGLEAEKIIKDIGVDLNVTN